MVPSPMLSLGFVLFAESSKSWVPPALLGVDLPVVLRLDRPPSLAERIRSVGFMSIKSFAQAPTPFEGLSLESSKALPLPFLLSLRLSRIPLLLRFLTAGLRIRPPVEDSPRSWVDGGPVEIAVMGVSVIGKPFRTILPVSICNGASPIKPRGGC